MAKELRHFVADFETTTDPEDCRVWAWGVCEIADGFAFEHGTDIDSFLDWCANEDENFIVSFHNLKFDSAFILSAINKKGFKHIRNKDDRDSMTYETLISDMGAYYSITIYFKKKRNKCFNKVTFLDSLKIFPNMGVADIANSFDLPIHKLELDYKAYREKGHELTETELAYLKNDVEIVARALKIFYEQGFKKMTIASNALTSFKSLCKGFKRYFPQLDAETDALIRKSYKGGFCYVNPVNQGKIIHGPIFCMDVNSLYPSILYNNFLPYGDVVRFEGRYEKDKVFPLYTQKLLCSFELKQGKIPSIQIKNNRFFKGNEYLTSSGGQEIELTLTSVDLELFFEQYDVQVKEWCGGFKFRACKGLFSNYIDYWTERKIQAKKDGNGGLYRISKLYMNSLYGKFATATQGRQKIPLYIDGVLHYETTELEDMSSVYIPTASFVTSYGRALVVRTSQALRDFTLKKYGQDFYLYSDTDSAYVHLNKDDLEELGKMIEIDPYKLGAWDIEQDNITRFKALRQKCYIKEYDGEIHATVAGCPKALSRLFTFENFNIGFTTADFSKELIGKDAKLRYRQVDGGVILQETDFTIK